MSFPNKHILVLDDEEMILNVMGELLKHFGCKFTLCKDGTEALEAIKNSETSFAAAIIDLTLKSNERGEVVAQEIRKLSPDTKLVVSSGYEDHPAVRDPKAHGFDAKLTKPYSVSSLQNVLAEL